MNEHEIAKKLTAYLDHGAGGLKPGIAYRLQLARQKAMEAAAESSRASEMALADTGGGNFRGRHYLLSDARIWISVLLLVGGLLYFQYWQSMQQVKDLIDMDAAILTSDLPVEAYLDRGFQNWLTRSEP
jgi:hypothetical protein